MKFGNSIHIIKSIIIAAVISVALSSCEKDDGGIEDGGLIVIQNIAEDGNLRTKGMVVSSNADLKGETFGVYASFTPVPSTYFNANATVNDDYSATISPRQYWPDESAGDLKFFSWYPYSGTYRPTVSFSTPGQMALSYSADASATNHVDVLAAISEPVWGNGVNIHFYHTLTKVSFTFRKENSAPDVVTINKIEFQDVGKSGQLTITDIPTFTSPAKPSFSWSNITTGNIASTQNTNNTVSTTATQIGETFLMLPAETFSATAKIVITTNLGVSEFNLRDIVAADSHSWKSGEYINYNIAISDMVYTITAQPLEWNDNPVNVIFDKQYYLKVEQTVVELGSNAFTVNIKAETNYKSSTDPNTGYRAGAFLASIEDPEVNVNSLDLDWVNVTMTETSTVGGIYQYNIELAAQQFSGPASKRQALFHINAGNMRHQMVVNQYDGDGTWLTSQVTKDATSPGSGETMDRYKIIFTSVGGISGGWNWKVSALSDPDDILLNKETILGATGGLSLIHI